MPVLFGDDDHARIAAATRHSERGRAGDIIDPASFTSSSFSVNATVRIDAPLGTVISGFYPATMTRRRVEIQSPVIWDDLNPCQVFEDNDLPLQLGMRYEGFVVYRDPCTGFVLVKVSIAGQGTSSVVATTTTTSYPCSGNCRYSYNNSTKAWDLVSNGCTSTTTTTTTTPAGTTTSTTTTTLDPDCAAAVMPGGTTTTPPPCQCVPPDFCPPSATCNETVTNCARGQSLPSPSCTTTTSTSTSSTTTGTTTTSANCAGCDWLWIPTVGWILRSIQCLGTGCLQQCSYPVNNGGNACTTIHTPCLIPPPPCQPSCYGYCQWVCDDANHWLFLGSNCSSYCGEYWQCFCETPSFPSCGACGNRLNTPCTWHTTPPPGTTTTGTTTSTTTTCAPDDCCGSCLWRWNPASGTWTNQGSTCTPPSRCVCSSTPPFNGTNDCEIFKTPCTKATTTTTSSTTTTTTTTACTSCDFVCNGVFWVVTDNRCNQSGCQCRYPPGSFCSSTSEGLTWTSDCCQPAQNNCVGTTTTITTLSTTTTTTSTTTTTTTTPPCGCGYRCNGSIWSYDYNTCVESRCGSVACESYTPPTTPCTGANVGQVIWHGCPGAATTPGGG
jgi:hypothetical protein